MSLRVPLFLCLVVTRCVMPGASPGAPAQGFGSFDGLSQGNGPLPGGDWATPFLGSPTELTLAERPDPTGAQSKGSISSQWKGNAASSYLTDASPVPFAFSGARQFDVYAVGHPLALGGGQVTIGVAHGVPAWIDPTRPYPEGEAPQFTFFRQLAGGARAYKHHRDNHDVTLFTIPSSSTWIVATEPAAERLGIALTSGSVDPPFLPMMQGGVGETAGTKDQVLMHNDGLLPNFDRAVGGGVIEFPNSGIVGNKTIYASPGDAAFAADSVRRQMATGGFNPAGNGGIVDAQAYGRVLVVTYRMNH